MAATNWDLESTKLCLNEITANGIINESYKPLTIFTTKETSSQNNEQTNLAETPTPPSRQILTPRKKERSKLYEETENTKTEFAELENLLMAEICDLKTNYAPNSELNSEKGNTLHKDQLIRSQNEEILFLGEENKNKNVFIKTLLENLELYNSQTEIRSSPCEQTFKEQRRPAKKNHLKKASIDNHVAPNRCQVLVDVAGNNNNVDVTIDKEAMNEQELDRLNKKSNGKTDKRKVSNLKKL